MRDLFLYAVTHHKPLRAELVRKFIKQFSLFSYVDRLSIGATDYPHYGYCIFQAARLASLLNYPKISAIEFGCGGGNGLLAAEKHINEVTRIFPVSIDLYGFDRGSGLPPPSDYRDMPYYFRPGLYKMDRDSLERKLKRAKLVIGDVKDTCATFMQKYDPAPIGCMFHDLDFYSSTRDALTIFDEESPRFLPRVFMYFDDIFGNNEIWQCNEFTGERLAIAEFNQKHDTKKICKDYYVSRRYPHSWSEQAYVHHDFSHPRYNDFIANEEQVRHERGIRLKDCEST